MGLTPGLRLTQVSTGGGGSPPAGFPHRKGYDMSKVYTGYVFGHYDSRGGTMFIVADDFADALNHYEKLFGNTPEEIASGTGLDEDFLGEATLEGIDHPSAFEHDLEDIGRVLMLGKFNDDLESPGYGRFDNGDAPTRLLFQPSSSSAPQWPSEIPEGFWQPRWNDDAYGFCVHFSDNAKWAEIDAENDAVVAARWGD